MVPTIAPSGTSFKGAAAYYLHDKDADTKERVAWTHTENLLTDDPQKAWKLMAWTAIHQATLKAAAGTRATGRKLEKPVFAFSVSWHPEQKPDKAHMLATAKEAAAVLGLEGHQAIFVSHDDEPQPHVHILVNRVHPETGKAATLSRSKQKLAAWALAYETKHGKIYCPARENNARSRKEKKPDRVRDPIIQKAWRQSDSGRGFQAALKAQGYTLAQGNRRFVVVDRWGKAINPVRQLPNVRAAEFKARLSDIDLETLPTAAAAQRAAKAQERKQYHADRKFEEWSAQYLNQNQDRQIEERAKLSERYHRKLEDKKVEMAAYYKLDEQRREIDQLRQRVSKPSLFHRLTGKAARDREALAGKIDLCKDSEYRMSGELGAITTERDLAMADLTDRHSRESELARAYIAERKPAFYGEELQSASERGGPGGNRDQGREEDGGRERVHYRHVRDEWPEI